MNKRFGFTLAEVLITLGIIGVVASITIPTLMNNIQDAQFKTAYKKAYSVASQAWLNAYSNGTLTPTPAWSDPANNNNFIAFKNEMKVSKDCGTSTSECWDMSGEMNWNGTAPNTDSLAFIDNSGMAWVKLYDYGVPETLLDTNGNKGPNQYGKDRFPLAFCYLTIDGSSGYNYKANVPSIFIYPDFPDADTSVWTTARQTMRCPSISTRPCYYNSWIIGEN